MTTGAGRRGRPADKALVARRRAQILDAAAKLFAERGYPGTDVQLVADALQVGKGTVYRYFPSKEELFLAAVDRGMRRLGERIEAATEVTEDLLERFTVAVRVYLEFFDSHPEIVELLIQERAEFRDRTKPTYFEHRDANVGPWREVFGELIAAGRVRDVPVERIVNVVSDLLYGTVFTNYFARPARSFEAQATDLLDIVLNGILGDTERQRRGHTRPLQDETS